MKKRLVLTLIVALFIVFGAFAADAWYYNMEIQEFSFSGLQNVSPETINDALYSYRYKPFTDELFEQLQTDLYAVDGIDFFTADAEKTDDGGLRVVFEFYEIPMVGAIQYDGNEVLKTRELREAQTTFAVGDFIDPDKKASFEAAVQQLIAAYSAKGFIEVPIEYEIVKDEDLNTYTVVFHITEGDQVRVTQFIFKGNDSFDYSTLKKQVSSKVKSLFNNGYLDEVKLKEDSAKIAAYYQTNGYIDVIVSDPIIDYVESTSDKYLSATVTFEIVEGQQWYYGGMEVYGNTIFSDAEIESAKSMKVGSVLNLEAVQSEYSKIADLYYNEGYIYNGMSVNSERDDTTMSVKYTLDITEGPQGFIEDIIFTGLEKTKEYVMRRELEIKAGEVFSKEKLITSAQNLYNTGLLANLDYDLMYGQTENGVILNWMLEEGNTKDIQFGATFGGTLNSFPISAFVQWNDHNLFGRAKDLGISLTLSPDTQSLNLSFGDKWFKNYRWANSFSFGVSHSKYDGELQLGVGAPSYYNGRNTDTWPLGYSSATEWLNANKEYPSSKNLMSYDLLTYSLGYNTGYTFIFPIGRLTVSGGASVSLNKAFYDDIYMPFEKLIYKYGQRWQFSNKISFGFQWDGRDYVTNTTKGYVLSASMTYAGGILGGLSNYIKVNGSAAGYLKLFSFKNKEDETKNIMLCASTSVSYMLKQFYNYEANGWNWYDPKLGATKYEMLYIDGMTIGRGFSTVIDQAFLWDNMLELSYVLVKNVVQAEAFVSATAVNDELSDIKNGMNWYFATGFGLKLKISGFPLGLYLVKNATYRFEGTDTTRSFNWLGGSYFHGKRDTSGMSLVLAISLSLI